MKYFFVKYLNIGIKILNGNFLYAYRRISIPTKAGMSEIHSLSLLQIF